MKIKIGISGKRFIAPDEQIIVKAQIKLAIENCLKKYKVKEFIGMSSLAIGADTLFAELVLNDFAQNLEVVLPFPVDEYEKDFDQADLVVFKALIGRASKVVLAGEILPLNHAQRNDGYFEAGRRIAVSVDQTIFVIDELKPAGKGGTADVLGFYAHYKGKEHGAIVLKASAKARDEIQDLMEDEYIKANANALSARDRYRLSWKLSLFIAWLGVGLFALSTGFSIHGFIGWLLSCLEFVLIGGLLLYLYFAKVQDFHGQYIRQRIRAEQLRLMSCFYQADAQIVLSDMQTDESNPITDIILKANRAISNRKYYSHYYSAFVINSLIEQQQSYHNEKIKGVGSKSHFFEGLNLWIGRLFFVNILTHFVLQSLHFFVHAHVPDTLEYLTVFLSIFLPASYASLEGMMYFRGWKQTKKHSAQVLLRIKACGETMPSDFLDYNQQQVKEQQDRCLNALASVMLSDNQSWRSILEDKASYHWIV